jgi:hypothetical protein
VSEADIVLEFFLDVRSERQDGRLLLHAPFQGLFDENEITSP